MRRTNTRNDDPKAVLIRRIDLFRGCSEADHQAVASAFDSVELPAGQVLTHQGRLGTEAFVLASGSAEVAVDGDPIAMVGPGAVIGEMALVDRGPRSATVTLTTDAVVLVADPQRFRAVLAQMPTVSTNVLASLSRRLRAVEATPEPV